MDELPTLQSTVSLQGDDRLPGTETVSYLVEGEVTWQRSTTYGPTFNERIDTDSKKSPADQMLDQQRERLAASGARNLIRQIPGYVPDSRLLSKGMSQK